MWKGKEDKRDEDGGKRQGENDGGEIEKVERGVLEFFMPLTV